MGCQLLLIEKQKLRAVFTEKHLTFLKNGRQIINKHTEAPTR
jgi:hypothetical protein